MRSDLGAGAGRGGVWAAQSPVKVVKQRQPEKALIFEVSIPAPRAAVWQAFTTSEGLSTWLTPGAVVELGRAGNGRRIFPAGRPAAARSSISSEGRSGDVGDGAGAVSPRSRGADDGEI